MAPERRGDGDRSARTFPSRPRRPAAQGHRGRRSVPCRPCRHPSGRPDPAPRAARRARPPGHKHDPLYRARKLLTLAAERLDDHGTTKSRGLLSAGDPGGQVYEAWAVKEGLRDLYTLWDDAPLARQWLDGLINDCRAASGPEVRGMARTPVQWRHPILAWHTSGHTNGPVEGLISLIKKLKRVAAGFRSFANYRLRILLACGGCNWALLGTTLR